MAILQVLGRKMILRNSGRSWDGVLVQGDGRKLNEEPANHRQEDGG
jgi:hypothetical protein